MPELEDIEVDELLDELVDELDVSPPIPELEEVFNPPVEDAEATFDIPPNPEVVEVVNPPKPEDVVDTDVVSAPIPEELEVS